MLRVRDVKRIMAFKAACGIREGSCFGVMDSRELRQPLGMEQPSTDPDFDPDKEHFSIYPASEGDVVCIYSVDMGLLPGREYVEGYKARVAYRAEGCQGAVTEWRQGAVAFSDLETRAVYYITREF